MASNIPKVVDVNELSKQKAYARKLKNTGFDFGFAVGAAFVESMRNNFYNHTGTALDEIIDNSIEAGAANVHVATGYGAESDSKPNAIAIIDDGHGMPADMVRPAVAWGGTHREGSRSGFGRFGFGLPSASVNQCRRFSVFSRPDGEKWHSVTVDLDEIRDGKYTDRETGKVSIPETTSASPPKWVLDYIKKSFPGGSLDHGTVVLWEKLDRISWKTSSALAKNLLQHFGITYRRYFGKVSIAFDSTPVEPTDPLFTTPGFRFFDYNEERAVALDPAEFDMTSKESGQKARVRIRYASFPHTFLAGQNGERASKENPRFAVIKENRGIIVCRNGRQLDVLKHTPWKNFENFRNNDYYWAAEIDVPAELDEELSISNTKQGVVISERLWDALAKAGMESALRNLRAAFEKRVKDETIKEDDPSKKRSSEQSMEESAKFKRTKIIPDSADREARAREALEQHVKRTARETSRPVEVVRQEVEEDLAKHPYRVAFEDMPGAPFFRVEQVGGSRRLLINRTHRFYSDIYAAPTNTRQVRAGLEILLFSIGEAELDAQGNPDRRTFYNVERAAWSESLSSALEILGRFVNETDVADDYLDTGDAQKVA